MKRIRKVFESDSPNRDWKIKNRSITREFEFSNFLEALGFVNEVARIAEELNHHPDIIWNYTKVIIESKTYDVDKITDKDYELAQRIDELEILD